MNSPPPSSLATLLSHSTTTEDDDVALMTYLREAGQLPYSESAEPALPRADATESHEVDAAAGLAGSKRADANVSASMHDSGAGRYAALNTVPHAQPVHHTHPHVQPTHDALPITAPAPASPIDTSVPIPETLASLPNPPDALYLAPLSGLPAAPPEVFPVNLSDRGEMGGKRRKALHERAGWKEMEEDHHRDKRVREEENAAAGFHDYGVNVPVSIDDVAAAAAAAVPATLDAVEAAPMPEEVTGMDAVMAVAAAAAATQPEQVPEEDKPTRGRAKGLSKESRAEQNRKAQQIFRRRREEKIKQLEADAAALVLTRSRLAVAEARITQLALDLEAKTIEAQALRTAVLTIATHAPVSVVTPQDNLTITPAEFEGRDVNAVGDGEGGRSIIALDSLARASRELAKVNRARRGDDTNGARV